MADLQETLRAQVKALAGNWTTYTPLGSFALYVVGYLTLRFHLTVLGIGTDLAVLDERYLFAGVHFLIYLVLTIPIIALLILPVVAISALLAWVLRRTATHTNQRTGWWNTALAWGSCPDRLAWLGIILSVCMIQFVMRQCFFFDNLLLAKQLPAGWLSGLLVTHNAGLTSLYFSGLVAGTAVTGGVCLALWQQQLNTVFLQFLRGLFTFLIAVQFLLLPVNYGIFIMNPLMPRVTAIGNEPVKKGQEAWLVWEGKEGATYLFRDKKQQDRRLITVPRKDIKKTEIIRYDRIMQVLFIDIQSSDDSKAEGERKPS